MRLLVVEDEPEAAQALARGLRENTFAVDLAGTGAEALERLHVNSYDLAILDVLLPGMSGFEVCAEMRRLGIQTPVLMLTALDDVFHRIEGLDRGADDYLPKPFDFGELLARIRALLRRPGAFEDSLLQIADLQLDRRSHDVRRNGRKIELTAREYALLEYLVLNAGRVIGRAEISEHVWDETYDPFSNLIEVYVQRLRRKIDTDHEVRLIHTRRGEGYRIAASEEEVHV
ncbi:MAG: response regulator transcription factor [Acidobacteriota bacterium]|nr:response regulator transcription factor [Acidobacteriota bacterium]